MKQSALSNQILMRQGLSYSIYCLRFSTVINRTLLVTPKAHLTNLDYSEEEKTDLREKSFTKRHCITKQKTHTYTQQFAHLYDQGRIYGGNEQN